ncbi:MAG: Serine/threonine-protein kinase PknD [Verrucomicrobiae bacterium]|nr:Serine/threonine-protein kinase PknD [Verrucomicrobiae bacterium]
MELELILKENNAETARLTLGSGEFVVGRDAACEVRIPSDAVSRRHARLTVAEDAVFIQDLGSANGTYVDGVRAEGRVALAPGQKIEIGMVVMQPRWATQQPGTQATVVETYVPDVAAATEALLHDHKYELGDVVAMGGMGVVRRAKDLRIRRPVAMKLMSPTAVDTLAKRLRFVEEAQVTGQLEHPNIVPVYDLGIDENDQPYYTMKFVRGLTLKVVLDDIATGKQDTIQQFPLSRLLTIFQKACDAVAFAHSKGIIHRDIKPENIMIGDFGEVLLMDWGLAKRTGHTETRLDETQVANLPAFHTADGAVLGTPHYMSPEQAEGKIEELDVRTDIFMLGGVLYSILTLDPPFPGATAKEALQRIRAGNIPPPAEAAPKRYSPSSLAAVAMKALQYRPEARYPTVRALQKDVEAYQGGFATSAEQASTFKQLVLLVRRRKAEFVLLAVALMAVFAVAGASVARIVASQQQAEDSLRALRAAAPAYASQANSLIEAHKFDEALGKISTALDLIPARVDFHVLKGNILQSQLRLADARDTYARALELEPNSEVAQQNLALCEKLLKDNSGREELLPASMNELQAAMLKQGRSAEALAMVRRLGKDTVTALATWRQVLEREGLLDKSKGPSQFIVDASGLFTLNLNRNKIDTIAALRDLPLKELQLMLTEVRDLSPLRGAPLQFLNLAGTPVADLEPLRGAPLKVLILAGCRNLTDLEPLADCRELETLILPPQPVNLDALRSLPKLTRIASPQRFGSGARDEIGARLARIAAPARGTKPLLDETQSAADFWREYDARSRR